MSVFGVILGIAGILISFLGYLLGIIGGIPAAVLGLLAVLLGFLARRKSKKGIPAIIVGVLAVVLAVALCISGINLAKSQLETVKANPEKTPTIAKYVDNIKPEMGLLGYLMVTKDADEINQITEEMKTIFSVADSKAPAATEAPAEAPAEEPVG